MTPAARVLVTHPGRQHSHQAALALEQAGLLQGYWAGVPATRPVRAYEPVALAKHRTRWMPIAVGMRRLGRLLPSAAQATFDYLACRAFDFQVAAGLARSAATAVIACEISALATFRRARSLGMLAILDAPSFHHRRQDAASPPTAHLRLQRRINAIKDAEIAAADHIITVSELARGSYLEAGAAAERVHAVSLGADLSLFRPTDAAQAAGPFTFVFAGALTRRKGLDLLLRAFHSVRTAMGGDVRLLVAGPSGDATALAREAGVVVHGMLRQAELRAVMVEGDCFVLPSRHDSFGMAVVEAMACGLPAIVSDMVGAKELIRSGANGWVVPAGDVDALARQMIWCAGHRDQVRAMRAQARAAAQGADWARYRQRFAELIGGLTRRA